MGTVVNDQIGFYKNCIRAFADAEYQVIMSIGNLVDAKELGEIPENISVHAFVDQIAVLDKADVFLSHCGMNSVNESLYYEVPLVMYPQTSEQGGVANRVTQVGAGIRLEKTSPEAIREAVEKVLSDPTYRKKAADISDGFKKCPGAKGAADKILQVCKK